MTSSLYLLYYPTYAKAVHDHYKSQLEGGRNYARLQIINHAADETYMFSGGPLIKARYLAGYAFTGIHFEPGVDEAAKKYLQALQRHCV